MGYGAFQPNGYQKSAYQIQGGAVAGITYGGGGNWSDRVREGRKKILAREKAERERLEAKRSKVQDELEGKEAELARIEAERLKDLSDQALQIQLLAVLEQINALEMERAQITAMIMKFIQEEDDIMCILYTLPFYA